jgi:hypothetical protein
MKHWVGGICLLVVLCAVLPAVLLNYVDKAEDVFRTMTFTSGLVLANVSAADLGDAERAVIADALLESIAVPRVETLAVNLTGVADTAAADDDAADGGDDAVRRRRRLAAGDAVATSFLVDLSAPDDLRCAALLLFLVPVAVRDLMMTAGSRCQKNMCV